MLALMEDNPPVDQETRSSSEQTKTNATAPVEVESAADAADDGNVAPLSLEDDDVSDDDNESKDGYAHMSIAACVTLINLSSSDLTIRFRRFLVASRLCGQQALRRPSSKPNW